MCKKIKKKRAFRDLPYLGYLVLYSHVCCSVGNYKGMRECIGSGCNVLG